LILESEINLLIAQAVCLRISSRASNLEHECKYFKKRTYIAIMMQIKKPSIASTHEPF
jgi:hypothetical protein